MTLKTHRLTFQSLSEHRRPGRTRRPRRGWRVRRVGDAHHACTPYIRL